MNNKTFCGLIFILLFAISCAPSAKFTSLAEEWEPSMIRFDSLNEIEDYPKNAILFAGSSSIRLWDDIETDMAPYAVIQRGYGGASYADLAFHIERITFPHQFAGLVLFAGNDIWGTEDDRSSKEITHLLEHIIRRVRKKFDLVPIFIIEVTHVPARSHLITLIDAQNQALKSVCDNYGHVHWIATRHLYLTKDDTIKDHLFRDDRVHQNKEGYRLWTEQIKEGIKQVLKQ